MPQSFGHFTSKARDAIRKAHELAIERGQNQVNSVHLMTALVVQEESIIFSILERLEVDINLLTDSLIEAIENPESSTVLSPSYQIYLTPDLAQVLEYSGKVASGLSDEFVSVEHLFVALLEIPSGIRFGHREQPIVQSHFRFQRVGGADPVNRALDLAA